MAALFHFGSIVYFFFDIIIGGLGEDGCIAVLVFVYFFGINFRILDQIHLNTSP